MRFIRIQYIGVLSVLLVTACNETVVKNAGNNPFVDPQRCGTKALSYTSINAQVFAPNCIQCHASGGLNLATYEGVTANLNRAKDAILGNRMPPSGPLSLDDKTLLLNWIAQGAPLDEEDANTDCLEAQDPPPPPPPVEPEPEDPVDEEPILQATYESLRANVLQQNCLGCHGAGSRIGDFASYEAITSTSNAGLFNQERPAESKFIQRLLTEDTTKLMPPPRTGLPRLAPEVVSVVQQWIANGLPKE